MSVSLQKVKFEYVNHQGMSYNGVVSADKMVDTGFCICTSSCEITINGKAFKVLWTFEGTVSSDLRTEQEAREQKHEIFEETPHTLPFKVMGTCYVTERQDALEKAYEMLYDFNRPVFVRLCPEPENNDDPNAIAVQINYDEDEPYYTVGYIARELTRYLHPVIEQLEVSIHNIRFCTTFQRIGFYIAINITKPCLWDEHVVAASKKVK